MDLKLGEDIKYIGTLIYMSIISVHSTTGLKMRKSLACIICHHGDIAKLSTKIRRRCLQFVGHCIRIDNEVFSDLVVLESYHRTRRGNLTISYIRTLERDIDVPVSDIRLTIMNRDVSKSLLIRETRIPKLAKNISCQCM